MKTGKVERKISAAAETYALNGRAAVAAVRATGGLGAILHANLATGGLEPSKF